MNTLKAIVWLCPILFMLHDFEEILFVNPWKKSCKNPIEKYKGKKIPFGDSVSTEAFSLAVAEEFLLCVIVTLLSCIFDNYVVWYGVFFVLNFHFVVLHFTLGFKFKSYVPGIITSIIFLPIGLYILYIVAKISNYSFQTIAVASIIGTIVGMTNLFMLHKYMNKIDKWLEKLFI